MHRIITVGREFGSGGREVGKRLAEALGIAYYDHEIIDEIAKRTVYDEAYVDRMVESNPMETVIPITIGRSFYPLGSMQTDAMYAAGQIYAEQTALLKELAERSDCVIVGRCADDILSDYHPFRLFIYADADAKLKRCRERGPKDEQLSDKALRKKINEVDSNRRSYYEFHTGMRWGDPLNYDLCINTTAQSLKLLAQGLAKWLQEWTPCS